MDGVTTIVKVAHVRLCHSRGVVKGHDPVADLVPVLGVELCDLASAEPIPPALEDAGRLARVRVEELHLALRAG